MRVLVACEYSGRVREAFRNLGHDAWSCDLFEDAEDGSPFHIKGDALDAIRFGGPWSLLVAHPPCTHLAVSGSRHFAAKRADGRQQEAVNFFMQLAEAPVDKIAIENPVCIMSSQWRKPDQVVQPWWFGHPEFKATCFWLKGLKPLVATDRLSPPARGTDDYKAWSKVHRMPPSPTRWKERSRTYQGIADAMAAQWGA